MTKFKDTGRNNGETDIERETTANMTVSNSKIEIDVLNNRKYFFFEMFHMETFWNNPVAWEGFQIYLHLFHPN